MRRSKAAGLIVAASVAIPAAALAQESPEFSLGTIDGLLSACTYHSENQAEVEYQFGSCIGFIRGVRVTMESISLAQGHAFSCPPGGATENGPLRDAVVEELRRTRADQLNISVFPVMDALRRLYPCPANHGAPTGH